MLAILTSGRNFTIKIITNNRNVVIQTVDRFGRRPKKSTRIAMPVLHRHTSVYTLIQNINTRALPR